MLKVEHQLRVEWGFCDPTGRMRDAQLFFWMDQATHRLCEASGFGDDEFFCQPEALGFPVVSVSVEKKKDLPKYGAILTQTSKVARIGNSSLRIEHEFECEGRHVASGYEVRVYGITHPEDEENLLAVPIPDHIKKNLSRQKMLQPSITGRSRY
ncbi:MAG: acyl-CoA thioesterase [Rhodobacteraceae bacterium]|nr:acyl-CoA thioesterase [Paracoccaceae bacterium]